MSRVIGHDRRGRADQQGRTTCGRSSSRSPSSCAAWSGFDQRTDTDLHWKVQERAGSSASSTRRSPSSSPTSASRWRSTAGEEHAGVVTFHQLSPDQTSGRPAARLGRRRGSSRRRGRSCRWTTCRSSADLKRFKELAEQTDGSPRGLARRRRPLARRDRQHVRRASVRGATPPRDSRRDRVDEGVRLGGDRAPPLGAVVVRHRRPLAHRTAAHHHVVELEFVDALGRAASRRAARRSTRTRTACRAPSSPRSRTCGPRRHRIAPSGRSRRRPGARAPARGHPCHDATTPPTSGARCGRHGQASTSASASPIGLSTARARLPRPTDHPRIAIFSARRKPPRVSGVSSLSGSTSDSRHTFSSG